jgi:uncharacterized integral membrane protein
VIGNNFEIMIFRDIFCPKGGKKMPYLLILAVIIAILAVIFALQNPDPITVSFLFFELQSSLALVLLLTLFTGILLGIVVLTLRMFKLQRKISAYKKEILDLEDRLQKALERKTERISPPPKSSAARDEGKDIPTNQ